MGFAIGFVVVVYVVFCVVVYLDGKCQENGSKGGK